VEGGGKCGVGCEAGVWGGGVVVVGEGAGVVAAEEGVDGEFLVDYGGGFGLEVWGGGVRLTLRLL